MKSNTRNQLYISPLSNISLMSGKGKIDNGGTRRNDLIIVEGFPALNSFPPQTDDDLSEKSSNDTKKSSVAAVSPDPLPLDSFLSHQSALTFPPCSGRTEQSQGLRDLLFDCEKAFAARSKEHDAAYSAGITYFLPCLMAPRCGLEALARRIFQSHVSGAGLEEGKDYDPERSGAEWWTLVLDSSAGGIQETADGVGEDDDREDDDNGEDDEVALHFDADYGLVRCYLCKERRLLPLSQDEIACLICSCAGCCCDLSLRLVPVTNDPFLSFFVLSNILGGPITKLPPTSQSCHCDISF